MVQQRRNEASVGYPKRWEDQEHYKGGWVLNRKGKLELKSGSRISKLL
ncbi:Respiratory nitrate reductase beta chain [Staphylococcus aureus]|uniref:Respiratory nitrate reductase beta chain n=1 Tax=Staphylococcus aureus TaxID=1280 RepID=A0A380DWN2_STAAU|nr:Respiratory nitrate reductase beta chain [Staphylococcus aureus]